MLSNVTCFVWGGVGRIILEVMVCLLSKTMTNVMVPFKNNCHGMSRSFFFTKNVNVVVSFTNNVNVAVEKNANGMVAPKNNFK